MSTTMDEPATSLQIKEAVAEVLREKDGVLREMILEVLEDVRLAEAMREAEGSERVSRDEVFKVLEGRECTGQKNLGAAEIKLAIMSRLC